MFPHLDGEREKKAKIMVTRTGSFTVRQSQFYFDRTNSSFRPSGSWTWRSTSRACFGVRWRKILSSNVPPGRCDFHYFQLFVVRIISALLYFPLFYCATSCQSWFFSRLLVHICVYVCGSFFFSFARRYRFRHLSSRNLTLVRAMRYCGRCSEPFCQSSGRPLYYSGEYAIVR